MSDQLLMRHNAAYSVYYAQRQVSASLWNARAFSRSTYRGGARHFCLGGATGGASFATKELSMVCVGLSERDLKNFGGANGGPGKNLGGQWPPLAPPLSTYIKSVYKHYTVTDMKVTELT